MAVNVLQLLAQSLRPSKFAKGQSFILSVRSLPSVGTKGEADLRELLRPVGICRMVLSEPKESPEAASDRNGEGSSLTTPNERERTPDLPTSSMQSVDPGSPSKRSSIAALLPESGVLGYPGDDVLAGFRQ